MNRPPATGSPPIWADKRQALCDALPWFKRHHGSLHTNDSIPKGFLIDGENTLRDMITNDVIITTLGGGRVRNQNGEMERVRESSNAALLAIQTAFAENLHIGVIVGNNCTIFPVQAPHNYNVLGWFYVTDVWTELDARTSIAVHKVRLERANRISVPWWGEPVINHDEHDDSEHLFELFEGDSDSELSSLRGSTPDLPTPLGSEDLGLSLSLSVTRESPAERTQCSDCESVFAQAFDQGWACLNCDCSRAFVLPDGSPLTDLTSAGMPAAPLAWCMECKQPSKTIFQEDVWVCLHRPCPRAFQFPPHIDPVLIDYSPDFINERTAFKNPATSLKPASPSLTGGSYGTELQFRVGIVCPVCNGCSRRRYWDRWVYETRGCHFFFVAAPPAYPIDAVREENSELNKRKSFKESKFEGVNMPDLTIGRYNVERFFLPGLGEDAEVIGSVHVFRATHPINEAADGPNTLWCELQSAVNQGFGLQRNPVRLAGHRSETLTRHFQQNWGAPYKFVVNVLSKSLSDAPDAILKSLMRLRWAGRVSVEKTFEVLSKDSEKHGIFPAESLSKDFVDFNELLSLGYMEGDRISYHDDGENTLGPTVATLSLGSPAVMAFRVKRKHGGGTGETLKFPIYHGDMVVMHGTDIHQYYEHKVDPHGMRRFAMTSRYIVPETLDQSTRAEAILKGSLPARAHAWQYDGN